MMQRFRLAEVSDLPEGGSLFEVAGHRIAVFRVGGDLYALGDRCSHAEASLSEGEIWDDAVECPRHGSEFDLRTGEPESLPATRPVPVYELEIEGDEVFVTVEPREEEE